MSHLLYASNEMFSSTQLIRKSKDIFDKLTKHEINKAVILRDGKPNFMLLDFNKYEEIMSDYKRLQDIVYKKEQIDIPTTVQTNKKVETLEEKITTVDDNLYDQQKDEILSKEDEELKKALAQIELLNLDSQLQKEAKDKLVEKSSAQIKEFWN